MQLNAQDNYERKLSGLRLLQNFYEKLDSDLIIGFVQSQLEYEL
jgi:hypothetical protein